MRGFREVGVGRESREKDGEGLGDEIRLF